MGGFDNGSLWGGIRAQTKQLGPILRGLGPPAPQAGVIGDLYIDTQTFFLYGKRAAEETDPWGHYLFQVPAAYRDTLKWFSSAMPDGNIGVAGDYCLLWGGYNNYGVEPLVYGPRAASGWPESGNGPDLLLDSAYAGYELPVGLSDEGSPIAFSASSQLVVAGLSDEYILAIPVAQIANSLVTDDGLLSTPIPMPGVVINPLYTAIDGHAV